MTYEFKVTRRVEFSDTDMEGIMHFSNFFRFMEVAEHAFLRSLGYSAVLSRNGLEVCLPRVHAECDYLAPLRFEDEVLIHLLVQRKGNRSLTYGFRFYRLGDPSPQAVAHGRLTAVCAARQRDGSFKSAPLPKNLAAKIREAPGGTDMPPVSNHRKLNSRPLPGFGQPPSVTDAPLFRSSQRLKVRNAARHLRNNS